MKVYGVTGGAGTGKSEVMKLLKEKFGGYVILSDDVARSLTLKGGISYDLIVDHFGKDILGEDGEIDRPRLAALVFSDKKELEVLNSLTHPYTVAEIMRQIDEIKKAGGYNFIALESAILFDKGFEKVCDEFWYVYSDPEIRRQRMKESRGYSDEKIDSIMKNQPDEKALFDRCQFVIENNGTIESLFDILKNKLESTC